MLPAIRCRVSTLPGCGCRRRPNWLYRSRGWGPLPVCLEGQAQPAHGFHAQLCGRPSRCHHTERLAGLDGGVHAAAPGHRNAGGGCSNSGATSQDSLRGVAELSRPAAGFLRLGLFPRRPGPQAAASLAPCPASRLRSINSITFWEMCHESDCFVVGAGDDVAGARGHEAAVRCRLWFLCLLRMLRQRFVLLLGMQLPMLYRRGLPRSPFGGRSGLWLNLLQPV